MNYFAIWIIYIKSAFEKDKISYLVLKALFFALNCSVLCFDLFSMINDYEQITIPIFVIAILAVLFLTSFIWGSLLCAEIVCRVRIHLQSKYFSKTSQGVK